MHSTQSFAFEFTTTNVGAPGSPVKRTKVVEGMNQLDAEHTLKKQLYRKGYRLHNMLYAASLKDGDRVMPPSKEYQVFHDLITKARASCLTLEAKCS
jgi:hypothetical protein